MKFAVITDIHGNFPALQAVLQDVDSIGDVQHIYCLGDMIAIGPDSNEVLDMLFTRGDISMITGNHDEAVLALVKGEKYPESHRHVLKHHQWIAERLDPIYIDYLSKLPRQRKLKANNLFITFTHYAIQQSVHISQDPFHSIVEPSLSNMENLFSHENSNLICFGHHHPQHLYHGMKTTYLNPGSLGCQSKPISPYAIVTVEDSINIQIKVASYDNHSFLKSYEELKVPERDFILQIFHGEAGT